MAPEISSADAETFQTDVATCCTDCKIAYMAPAPFRTKSTIEFFFDPAVTADEKMAKPLCSIVTGVTIAICSITPFALCLEIAMSSK